MPRIGKKNKSANLVEEAKKSLVQSVLQHLESANKEKTSTKKTGIKRKYGEVLTENQALKQLEDGEAKKLNKKRKKKTIISDEEDEEESGIEISPLYDQTISRFLHVLLAFLNKMKNILIGSIEIIILTKI
ncbi:hypothetical protein BpHYR1_044910 [Brachionus plicatilis]|uniref:Uncharacterized protein n=1 Tax=Brachionus plicatilis TaxID=10195 RepID=A0A3M7PGR8_BRAPC|nr:hypothetical protein BpHYR1_044910 [Brachionus plicatilis]